MGQLEVEETHNLIHWEADLRSREAYCPWRLPRMREASCPWTPTKGIVSVSCPKEHPYKAVSSRRQVSRGPS